MLKKTLLITSSAILLFSCKTLNFDSKNLTNPATINEISSPQIKQYRQKAKGGDLYSCYALASFYQRGIGVKANPKIAFAYLSKAIEGAYTPAYALYATTLAEGIGTDIDVFEAFKYYNLAAKLTNDSNSWLQLGRYQREGRASKQDWNGALKSFNKAVALGNKDAMAELGNELMLGRITTQDIEKGKQLLLQADTTNADLALANYYEQGQLLKKDLIKAFEFYHRAAKKGSPIGAYKTGEFYLRGTGVKKNTQKATQWLSTAGKKKYRPAALLLADHYYKQHSFQATTWYKLAAAQKSPRAFYQLGKIFIENKIAKVDYKKAKQLLTISADLQYLEAKYLLGSLFYQNAKFGIDYPLAHQYLLNASLSGHKKAPILLSSMLESGYGVTQSSKLACTWLMIAQRYDSSIKNHLLVKFDKSEIESIQKEAGFLFLKIKKGVTK